MILVKDFQWDPSPNSLDPNLTSICTGMSLINRGPTCQPTGPEGSRANVLMSDNTGHTQKFCVSASMCHYMHYIKQMGWLSWLIGLLGYKKIGFSPEKTITIEPHVWVQVAVLTKYKEIPSIYQRKGKEMSVQLLRTKNKPVFMCYPSNFDSKRVSICRIYANRGGQDARNLSNMDGSEQSLRKGIYSVAPSCFTGKVTGVVVR